MRIKIQRQKEDVEQKLEDAMTTILTMGEMKANIEKAVTEINSMQEEMLKGQRRMEKNKEEVKKFLVSKFVFFFLTINKDFPQQTF